MDKNKLASDEAITTTLHAWGCRGCRVNWPKFDPRAIEYVLSEVVYYFLRFSCFVRLRPKITVASFAFSLDAVVFWIMGRCG